MSGEVGSFDPWF